MITGRKDIAKTSSTPGKTQMLNMFDVDETWRLVDLPGYGYAKVSKKHRASLRTMIEEYISTRPTLHCAFVLLDGSIPLQKIDREMIEWLGSNGVPQAWVFTKVDKGRSRATAQHLEDSIAALSADWEDLPPYFKTSSEKTLGREEVLTFIASSLPPA